MTKWTELNKNDMNWEGTGGWKGGGVFFFPSTKNFLKEPQEKRIRDANFGFGRFYLFHI